jgi:hypothetical protein
MKLRIAGLGLVLIAAPLFAGGFWLQMGTPEASPEAKAKNAALVVRATGCHDPATAEVSGVVIRMVEGRKQTTPLKLVRMKEPGTFAVMRDWPADTSVTLEFVGPNARAVTSMLVRARGESVEKASAKFFLHEPTVDEEMALLVR